MLLLVYFSFAAPNLQKEGAAPAYAFAEGLKDTAKEGATYHLAFDEEGNYTLGRKRPSAGGGAKGAKKAKKASG